jgi:hypothetical protein
MRALTVVTVGYLVSGMMVLINEIVPYRLSMRGKPRSFKDRVERVPPYEEFPGFRSFSDGLASGVLSLLIIACWPIVLVGRVKVVLSRDSQRKAAVLEEKEMARAFAQSSLRQRVPDSTIAKAKLDISGHFDELRSLMALQQEGDELWDFSSPSHLWAADAGRGGWALVRGGVVLEAYIVVMN